MKKRLIPAAAVWFAATVTSAWAQGPEGRHITMDEAWNLALARSEEIARQESSVKEAEARVAELTGTMLPRLDLDAAHTRQETPAGSAPADGRTSVWLNLRQPLFSGFREFLARKAGKESLKARTGDLEHAKARLYLDTVQAYLAVYGFQREAAVRSRIRDHLTERVAVLEKYRAIGRTRESELISAKYQLAQAEAQLKALEGDEMQTQEALRFITGVDEDMVMEAPAMPKLPDLAAGLATAAKRGDVGARRRDLEAAAAALNAAQGERLPVIAAEGNYRLMQDGNPKYPEWDAGIALTIPLFAGGSVSARIREAGAAKASATAALSRAERSAAAETRSAHRRLGSAIGAMDDFIRAQELADANVKAQEKDYMNGQATNLEVLAALNSLLESDIQLEKGRIEAVLAAAAFSVAAGEREGRR